MRKPCTVGSFALALIVSSGTAVDAQVRVPGWNRVAPPGGHQNDPQLVRPTGGPVVPIFEGWFPNRTSGGRAETGCEGT